MSNNIILSKLLNKKLFQDFFTFSPLPAGVALLDLQLGSLWPLPRQLQHFGPASAWDPSGNGARGLESRGCLPVRDICRVALDERAQARRLSLRGKWWCVRLDHGAPGHGHHEPQGDVVPVVEGGRGFHHSNNRRGCVCVRNSCAWPAFQTNLLPRTHSRCCSW